MNFAFFNFLSPQLAYFSSRESRTSIFFFLVPVYTPLTKIHEKFDWQLLDIKEHLILLSYPLFFSFLYAFLLDGTLFWSATVVEEAESLGLVVACVTGILMISAKPLFISRGWLGAKDGLNVLAQGSGQAEAFERSTGSRVSCKSLSVFCSSFLHLIFIFHFFSCLPWFLLSFFYISVVSFEFIFFMYFLFFSCNIFLFFVIRYYCIKINAITSIRSTWWKK